MIPDGYNRTEKTDSGTVIGFRVPSQDDGGKMIGILTRGPFDEMARVRHLVGKYLLELNGAKYENQKQLEDLPVVEMLDILATMVNPHMAKGDGTSDIEDQEGN